MWIDAVASFAFWLSLIGVVYHYAGYPILIWLASRAFGRRRSPHPESVERQPPTVALVICALNEGGVIGDRVRNALATEYPSEKFRLVVASDGSTDNTV